MYILTKFERTRMIGVRAEQLAKGAMPMTDITGMISPYEIALKELKEKVIPIVIVRTLPNGQEIELKIEDFEDV